MKRSLLIAALSLLPLSYAFAVTETYTFDPEHTFVTWQINHLGFTNQTGKWYANGSIELDNAKIQNSKVSVTIKVSDMVTGIPALDEHLKGKLFFDVEKYPTATFVSDKIEVTGNNSAKVQGKLTVHGVTKPITLSIKLNKKDVNPISNKLTMGLSGTAELKRSDFNINTLLPALGDEVKLSIEAEATKSQAKTQEK